MTAQPGGHEGGPGDPGGMDHGGGPGGMREMFRGDSLQPITVTGTFLIVKDTTKFYGTRYYLDTNNDGVGDYILLLGRHVPSGVTLPTAGQSITVTGGVITRTTPNGILVFTIDGVLWPDTTRMCGGGRNDKHYVDSLQQVTETGVVIIKQDTTRHNDTEYYLDTNGDGVGDYLLLLGPPWYTPPGATHPTAGQTITVTGGLFTTRTPNAILVLTLDGILWRDTTRTDHRGHGFSDSIHCHLDTSKIPGWHHGFAQGFHMSVTNGFNQNMMSGGRYQFNKAINVTLVYNVNSFSNESQLAPWRYQDNNWVIVSSFSLDTKNHSVTFSENQLYEYYAVAPRSVTAVTITAQPTVAKLEQNYPNPVTSANTTTEISYSLSTAAPVRLVIYNVIGQIVNSYNPGNQNAGYYTLAIDVSDMVTGYYFYRLEVGNQSFMKKLTVLK